MQDGNNLMSYPYYESQTIESAIANTSLDDGVLFRIIGQGVAAQRLVASGEWVGSLTSLQAGKGYWMVSTDYVETFEYNMPDLSRSFEKNELIIPDIPNEFKYEQSTAQAFYFVDDIELNDRPIEIGDLILTYSNDIIVGARYWTGEMIDVPAMGNDFYDNTIGYLEEGDIPEFKIYRHSSGELVDVYASDIPEWNDFGMYNIGTLTDNIVPSEVSLNNAYPNPFNPLTKITYSIPDEMNVNIKIYDISGRLVNELLDSQMSAGSHEINWDATENASGIYFLRMVVNNKSYSQKLILIK